MKFDRFRSAPDKGRYVKLVDNKGSLVQSNTHRKWKRCAFISTIIILILAGVGTFLGIWYWPKSSTAPTSTVTVATASSTPLARRFRETTQHDSTSSVGWSSPTSLELLEYYITSIQLCESVTLTGTAWSDTKGCVVVYANTRDEYATYTPTKAAADRTVGNYIDFTNSTSRALLKRSVELVVGSTFNWVITNWHRPIRYRATLTLSNGHIPAYSKAATSYQLCEYSNMTACATGRCSEGYVSSNSFFSGPAETAIDVKDNGGSVFKMQAPLVIAHNETYRVALAYNLDSVAKIVYSSRCGSVRDSDTPGTVAWQIRLPFMSFAPVAYRTGELVKKEVYIVQQTMVSPAMEYRIEFYFTSNDPGVVRAVDTQELYSLTTVGDPVPFGGIFYVEKNNSTQLYSLLSYDRMNIITELGRGVDGNLRWHCTPGIDTASCPTGTHTRHILSYRFMGILDVTEQQ